jgi:predicted O-methyltransferase YrrM
LNFLSLFKRNIIYKLKKKINIDKSEIEKKSLDELFCYYGSDKANFFKKADRDGHGYSRFYTNKLNKLKNKHINILEIGSYAGASAAAFVKYFPNANVFCIDVNISNFEYQSKKIHVYGIDANNEIKVKKILNKIFKNYNFNNFDLIIDDSSHNLKDILLNLNFYFKYLIENGIFVIEDFKHPNYYEYNKNIDHILVDEFLNKIEKKIFSSSSIINEADQKFLMDSIDWIDTYKGNLSDSDICFIKKITK